jgi:hypothetical protein
VRYGQARTEDRFPTALGVFDKWAKQLVFRDGADEAGCGVNVAGALVMGFLRIGAEKMSHFGVSGIVWDGAAGDEAVRGDAFADPAINGVEIVVLGIAGG